ncbi:OadG family protein [Romboutsia sedimentorum]|uniref:OadG family protein n=1 Tax=Romboutsia sedimentorum TaxID=1368474 RepID=A0ABT7EDT1_9FIRM|nr:OadG family protein [Romboutsia sedimentorum]MDK2565095.1 OadG family protein [Romboutsia sedimentorum]MDK2587559.1 OadG family protein [Romboutsia sedimentorum]
MNISQLLESLKDPSAALSIGDKLLGGFIVAILSMSVVFIVLVIIAAIISLLQREKAKPVTAQIVSSEPLNMQKVINETQDMGELVAVITAAICAATGNNTNNILVRKIVRSNNSKSSWESMSKNTTK